MNRLLMACTASLIAMFGLAVPAVAAAPTITSFTPTSGPLRTSVKITGSNFVAPVTVKFNGTAATSVVVNSSTQLTAQVPGSANSGPISVTSGGATVTSAASFTVTPGVYLPVTAGPPGSKVAVYFSGFAAYEAVDVYVDSTDLKLVSASSTGSGVATPVLPAKLAPGDHVITAVGRKSGSSAQGTFTVRTDWPQYGADSARTGSNVLEATLGQSNVRRLARSWRRTVSGGNEDYLSNLVVAGGIAYVTDAQGVTALNATSGAVVWSRNVGPVTTPAAVAGGTVVVTPDVGDVVGLNAATGAVRYDNIFAGQLGVANPLAVAGGTGYAQLYTDAEADTAAIFAFDVATGALKWNYLQGERCATPAVSGSALFLTCDDNHLYAVRTSNGSLLFDKTADVTRYVGTPAIIDDLVICAGIVVGTNTSVVASFDVADGIQKWRRPSPVDVTAGMAITAADDQAYLRGNSSNAPAVGAVAVADGSTQWITSAPENPGSRTAVANGLLYVPGYFSTDVLDASSGGKVGQFRAGVFSVVTDAGVFGADNQTEIVRYSLPASSITAAVRPNAAQLRPNRSLQVTS